MLSGKKLHPAWYVFLFSVTLRLAWASFAVVTPISDFAGYENIASIWINTGEFGGLLGAAYRTPGHPAYLALIYLVFGHSWYTAGLVNAVVGGLTSGLLVLLAGHLVSRRASVIAGLLHALSPTALAYVPVLASEHLAVFALVASLLALARAHQQDGRWRYLLAFVSGALFCLLILTRPVCVLMAPAFVLLAVVNLRRWRLTPKLGATFVVALALGFAPWAARNVKLGLPPLTLSTQGALALWWDISPYANPDVLRKGVPEFARGVSEKERGRVINEAVFDWVKENPGTYLALTRARIARIFGTRPDYWAAIHLVPTQENDQLRSNVYRSWALQWQLDPSSIAQHRAMITRNSQFLYWHRVCVAPLILVALLLSLTRLSRLGMVVLPVACYVGGLALTVFAERYREMSDPLLFVVLGALLSDLLFGTCDLGRWRARRVKLVVALLAIGASILLHTTGLLSRWSLYPAVHAPSPTVSSLDFQPVELTQPSETYLSHRSRRTERVAITREGDALRCEIVGSSTETAGSQYGGIKLFVLDPEAFTLRLTFQQARNIDAVFVCGYDVAGQKKLQWQWDCEAGANPDETMHIYTFVPGARTEYFRPIGEASIQGVEEIDFFVRVAPNTTAGFILHGAEIAESKPGELAVSALEFEPVELAQPPETYLSHRSRRTERVGVTRDGSALRCEIVGSSTETAGAQYGGIRLSILEPEAFKLQLTLQQTRNIDAVFVCGYDGAGQKKVQWQWDCRAGVNLDEMMHNYTFVPGIRTKYFRPIGEASIQGVEEINLFVRVVPNTTAGFILHGVEIVSPEFHHPDVSPFEFMPADLSRPLAEYQSKWTKRLDDVVLEKTLAGGLRFHGRAWEAATRGRYGGVRLQAPRPVDALRLRLAFEHPENIIRIFVDGHDAIDDRVVRWSWSPGPSRPLAENAATYSFVPGEDSGYFICQDREKTVQIDAFHVFLLIKEGAAAGLVLEEAEWGTVTPDVFD